MSNYHGTRTVRTYISDGRGPPKVETKTFSIGGPAGTSIGFAPTSDFGSNMTDLGNFGGQMNIDFGDNFGGGRDMKFNVGRPGVGGGHSNYGGGAPNSIQIGGGSSGGGGRYGGSGGRSVPAAPTPAAHKPKVVGRPSRAARKDPFAGYKTQMTNDIKSQCASSGVLFEDPEFPCVDSSIFYSRPCNRRFEWLRPQVS